MINKTITKGIFIKNNKIFKSVIFYNKKYKLFLKKKSNNFIIDFKNECKKGDKILFIKNNLIKIY